MGFSQPLVSMAWQNAFHLVEFLASVGKNMGRAPLSRWLERRVNKVPRGLCSRQNGQPKTEQERGARKCIYSSQS